MYNGPHIVTDGLVLYLDAANIKSYPGSGTAWNDLSGNNNNSTLTNGPTFSSNNNGSIVFDGVDDYSNIPDSTSMQVSDVFTVNAWVFPTNLNARYGVFSTRRLNAAGSWQLEVGTANGGANRVAVTGVGTWIFETSSDVINPNIWANICFVKPGNGTLGGILYINGTSVSPLVTTSYTILNNLNDKVVGSGTSLSQFFPGRIANVSLYNRALSAPETLQNYLSQKSRFNL